MVPDNRIPQVIAELRERLTLCGYVVLADHGFALPAFASAPGANAWHVAVAKTDGDHLAAIDHFELLEDEQVVRLPASEIIVGPGDRWQDVFLWEGRVFAGTPPKILQDHRDLKGPPKTP